MDTGAKDFVVGIFGDRERVARILQHWHQKKIGPNSHGNSPDENLTNQIFVFASMLLFGGNPRLQVKGQLDGDFSVHLFGGNSVLTVPREYLTLGEIEWITGSESEFEATMRDDMSGMFYYTEFAHDEHLYEWIQPFKIFTQFVESVEQAFAETDAMDAYQQIIYNVFLKLQEKHPVLYARHTSLQSFAQRKINNWSGIVETSSVLRVSSPIIRSPGNFDTPVPGSPTQQYIFTTFNSQDCETSMDTT